MPAEKCRTFFVTGTDTGVGKTLVSAALAVYLRRRGLSVGVMKPIETGVADPAEPGDDAKLLHWAAGAEDPIELVAPYRFQMPAAPSQASEAAGGRIDVDQIEENLSCIRQGKDLVLIEGAGGLMVPIRGGFLMADMAKRFESPLLLVTHPRLGTINHTLLTTLAAHTMDLTLAGYFINRMPAEPDRVTAEAPHLLAALASADLLGVLPEVAGEPRKQVEALADAIAQLSTIHWLDNALRLHP